MIAIDFLPSLNLMLSCSPLTKTMNVGDGGWGERLSNMERRHNLSVHLFVSVSCLAINYENKTVWQYLLKIDLGCSKAKTVSIIYFY